VRKETQKIMNVKKIGCTNNASKRQQRIYLRIKSTIG